MRNERQALQAVVVEQGAGVVPVVAGQVHGLIADEGAKNVAMREKRMREKMLKLQKDFEEDKARREQEKKERDERYEKRYNASVSLYLTSLLSFVHPVLTILVC